MNNEHRKKPQVSARPSLPVGDGAPEGTRCLQIVVPDSDLAARQLLGVMQGLTYWRNYERDAAHNGIAWAQAWIAAIAGNSPVVECDTVNFMMRACSSPDCGLEYSLDGGDTWTCVDLSSCIETIWDEKLAGAFDDGVLGQGTGQQGPSDRPAAFECKTYHVKLGAFEQWHCPNPLTTGDTLVVTNMQGGWSDGSLAWYCPDGSRYLLGACSESLKTHVSGDPLNPGAYHMALVGVMGSTYFDPTTLYTVPSPTPLTDTYLQANDASLAGNMGEITFDVTVCSSDAVEWCHEYDFTQSKAGWDIYPNPLTGVPYGTYVAGHGFKTDASLVCWFRTDDLQPGITISHIEAEMEDNSGDAYHINFWFYPLSAKAINASITSSPQIVGDDWVTSSDDNIYWWMQLSMYSGAETCRKIRLYGNQTANPFGESNCEA